jgi:hypothetical protein
VKMGRPSTIFTSPTASKRALSPVEWLNAFLSYAVDCRDYCAAVAGEGEAHRLFTAMMMYQGRISSLVNAKRPWDFVSDLDLAWRSGIQQGSGSWQEPSTAIFASLQMDASLKLFTELSAAQARPSAASAVSAAAGSSAGSRECKYGLACKRQQCSFEHPHGFVPTASRFSSTSAAGTGKSRPAKKGKGAGAKPAGEFKAAKGADG